MKQTIAIFLVLALMISLGSTVVRAQDSADMPPEPALDGEGQENVTLIANGDDLVRWLKEHVNTPATARLTASVTLPAKFDYAYWSEEPLTIETGAFSLYATNAAALNDLNIVGEGVDNPVLVGTRLTLTQCSITAEGRDGIGGTAVAAKASLSLYRTTISAYGEAAIGADSPNITGEKSIFLVDGEHSVGVRLYPPENAPSFDASKLVFCNILAVGQGAASIVGSGEDSQLALIECTVSPAPEFGTQTILEPAEHWNTAVQFAAPETGFVPPDTAIVNFQSAMGFATAQLAWQLPLPDFSTPGTYQLSATVTSCELQALVGQEYQLTVQIGERMPPVFTAPAPGYFNQTLYNLRFRLPTSINSEGGRTKLWCSADGGASWSIGAKNVSNMLTLSVESFARQTPYLLVLQSEQDGIMHGLSTVWQFTIDDQENYEFVETTLPPPNLNPPSENEIASWNELLAIVQDKNRIQTKFSVTADLVVDSYVDLQSMTPPLHLDMGTHGIVVKDGGWLVLGIDTLSGSGAEQPLITVEGGGSLLLGRNMFYAHGIGRTAVVAKGSGQLGGVAVAVEEGGYFSAINHPSISAHGPGAVAVRSLTQHSFFLPAGLSLQAEGQGAAALETAGSIDLFYTNVQGLNGAQAVRMPQGAAVVIDSAHVSPQPEHSVVQTSTFVDFNQDMDQPQNLWLGPPQGMYLTNVPVLATVARGGNPDNTAAIWVNRQWDASGVDFTAVGNYRAASKFSPLLPVEIGGLPLEKSIDVSIKDPKGRPDISIMHPLPPVNMGGEGAVYGLSIVPNAIYTQDMATLWCSEDNGETWIDAQTVFNVFFPPNTQAGMESTIYMAGLMPDKPYLFRLESSGRTGGTDGPYAGAGTSNIRQVTVSGMGEVVNLDWSGDRDGGDVDGNSPPEVVIPPSTPSEPPNSNTGSTPENEIAPPVTPPAQELPAQPNFPSKPVPKDLDTPASGNLSGGSKPVVSNKPPTLPKQESVVGFSEESGPTISRISGARLHKMANGGPVQFSKQGVAVTLSAQAIADLSIDETSLFSIKILRQSDTAFSIAVTVDDRVVKHLADTKVILPYVASSDTPLLTLQNEAQDWVSTGSYNTNQQTAAFSIDTIGSFTIVEDDSTAAVALPPEAAAVSNPANPAGNLAIVLLGCVGLLALGGGLIIWKRRSGQ